MQKVPVIGHLFAQSFSANPEVSLRSADKNLTHYGDFLLYKNSQWRWRDTFRTFDWEKLKNPCIIGLPHTHVRSNE